MLDLLPDNSIQYFGRSLDSHSVFFYFLGVDHISHQTSLELPYVERTGEISEAPIKNWSKSYLQDKNYSII